MHNLALKPLLLVLILTAIQAAGFTQELASDNSTSEAYKRAISYYNKTLFSSLHIFNGKEYREYVTPFNNGHPYFITDSFTNGSIFYDGNNYINTPLLYNLAAEQIIIPDQYKRLKILLDNERIISFTISGHSFINITNNVSLPEGIKPGFYDVVAKGKVSLLVKRQKIIETEIRQRVEYDVYSKNLFYLKRSNSYIHLKGKKDILNQLSDKKKEIMQFIRENKLKYKNNQENYMLKLVEYYNSETN